MAGREHHGGRDKAAGTQLIVTVDDAVLVEVVEERADALVTAGAGRCAADDAECASRLSSRCQEQPDYSSRPLRPRAHPAPT